MVLVFIAALAGYALIPRKPAKIAKVAPSPKKDELSKYPPKGPFWSSKKDYEQPCRYAENGVASESGTLSWTIPQFLAAAAKKRGNTAALRIERPLPKFEEVRDAESGKVKGYKADPSAPRAEWKTWSFSEYLDVSRQTAKAMMACGVKQFDSVNVFGFNSPEWFFASMGSIFAGAKTAGIYPSDTAEQMAYKCDHSDAKVAVVEDQKKIDQYAAKIDELKDLNAIVAWGCKPAQDAIKRKSGSSVPVYSWDEFLKLADKTTDAELDERISKIKPGHACTIIYTSGTTGFPKAVMVSHDNIAFEAASVVGMLKDDVQLEKEEENRIISYLPLSHVAGMMVDIVVPVIITATYPAWMTVHFARPYDLSKGTIGDRLRAVQPTMFLGVPRVWEKIAEKMKAMGASTKGAKLAIAKFAKGKGLEHARACEMGSDGSYPSMYGLAEKLVLSKVKAALGLDKCKFGFTGAAPIQVDTLEYFGALGIQINEVYGMSECTGATTFSLDAAHVWGSCGFASAGTEVKVFKVDEKDMTKKKECPPAKNMFQPTEEEQGELCYRGRHIMMGYMANPKLGEDHVKEIEKKNRETIDEEGWLHSGDKGCCDERGMFRITGRYKELIIGAGGENIAPVPIEDNIKKLCPFISNVMMVGDKRKYNTCLIALQCEGATGEVPGSNVLAGAAKTLDPACKTIEDAKKSKIFNDTITKAIQDTNKNDKVCPSNAAAIQKFAILPNDFSVEGDELTATLKLKRGTVDKKYKALIDQMY
jgi:long-chain-fatty-acid--CoA ligase ACSBG